MRTPRLLLGLLVLSATGAAVFGLLHYASVSYEKTRTAEAISAACRDITDLSTRRECYGEKITELIHTSGAIEAFAVVSDLYQHDSVFQNKCHYSVHAIGKAAYAEYKRSQKTDFITADAAFCNYGFYHGFMIALLADTKDVQVAKKFCDALPSSLLSERGDSDNQCYHGMGHGFVDSYIEKDTWHETDLAWVKKEERAAVLGAVANCAKLSTDKKELSSCYSGVFHDLAMLSEEENWAVDNRNPLWLCEETPAAYQDNCTGNMHRLMLEALPQASLTELAAFAASRYGTSTSFFANTVWRWAGTHTKSLGPAAVVAACRELEPAVQWQCITGSLAHLEDNGIPQEEYKAVSTFCSMPALSGEEKSSCVKNAFNYFKGIYPSSKLDDICRTYRPLYDAVCP